MWWNLPLSLWLINIVEDINPLTHLLDVPLIVKRIFRKLLMNQLSEQAAEKGAGGKVSPGM